MPKMILKKSPKKRMILSKGTLKLTPKKPTLPKKPGSKYV